MMQLISCELEEKVKTVVLEKSSLLYRFLYIVGIQSVRILKRVKRRLHRFFRPVNELCANVVRRYVGARINEIKKEFFRIKDGFYIGVQRIKDAKKQGVLQCAAECAKVVGKSMVRHRQAVGSVLNIAAPVAAIVIMAVTIHFWTSQNFGLVLAYDGQQIATIEDEQIFAKATDLVNSRLVSDAAAGENLKITPRYTLTMADSTHYATAGNLCEKLIEQSDGVIEDASGLYVDGKLLGAVQSNMDLRFILQSILNTAKGTDTNAEVSFAQKVDCVDGLYPVSNIISSEDMKSKLNATTQSEAFYTVKPGDTFSQIASDFAMSTDVLNSLNAVNPDELMDGQQLKVQKAKSFLTVEVTKQEAYETVIPYSTITESDDDEYTDFTDVTQAGADGTEACVDKVVYIDGVEASRQAVSRTVAQPAVDEIVTVGTKERPATTSGYRAEQGSGRSTGNLMWPVPYTHGITSLYEIRWGVMHNGIDISSGGIYGQSIVAADGGTVTNASYSSYGYGNHVEISHGNGITTLYGHCSALYVSVGQKVSKGQVIAAVGSTGDSSGPHLHFEVSVNGSRTNPLNYVG